jgi:hypothetical protein
MNGETECQTPLLKKVCDVVPFPSLNYYFSYLPLCALCTMYHVLLVVPPPFKVLACNNPVVIFFIFISLLGAASSGVCLICLRATEKLESAFTQ